MSAADAREQLEAAVHRELSAAFRRGCKRINETITGPFPSEQILALADAYAHASVADVIDQDIRDERARERLTKATNEKYGSDRA